MKTQFGYESMWHLKNCCHFKRCSTSYFEEFMIASPWFPEKLLFTSSWKDIFWQGCGSEVECMSHMPKALKSTPSTQIKSTNQLIKRRYFQILHGNKRTYFREVDYYKNWKIKISFLTPQPLTIDHYSFWSFFPHIDNHPWDHIMCLFVYSPSSYMYT